MDEYSSNSNEDFFFSMTILIFLLEIAVGGIQLLGALIRTVILVNSGQSIGKLKIYWIMIGIYFLVFFGLYFTENYIINDISFSDVSGADNYLGRMDLYQYLMFAHIAWVFLAWGIAIWYCIKIVFVKRQLINSSTL